MPLYEALDHYLISAQEDAPKARTTLGSFIDSNKQRAGILHRDYGIDIEGLKNAITARNTEEIKLYAAAVKGQILNISIQHSSQNSLAR